MATGQLEHGAGPRIPGEAARRDFSPDRTGPAVAVEEDEVERETHADGVDAGAARDQHARANLVAVEMGKAK